MTSNFSLHMLVIADVVAAVLEVVLEDVAHGVNLDVVARARGLADVLGGAGAAAAAADQADLDGVAAGGVGVGHHAQADRGRGRCLQEITARSGR